MIVSESAGGVIVNNEKKICLVNQHGVCWALPKGHIEDGENIEDAARREIKEETGLEKLKLIKNLGILKRRRYSSENEMKHIHVFLFKTQEENLRPDPNDNCVTEAKWFVIDDAISTNFSKEEKEFLSRHKTEILTA